MLDKVYAVHGQLRKPVYNPAFSHQDVINRAVVTESGTSAQTLTVIYPPWQIPKWLSDRLIHKLVQQGSDVLLYDFDVKLLNDDPAKVRQSFEYIADTSSQEIKALAARKQYAEINLLGFSLGNVSLALTAQKLDAYHTVTMVVPGSDLLDVVWNGQRTKRLRAALEEAGHTYDDIRHEWSELGPVHQIPAFRNHPTEIVLSSRDIFIPYVYGKQLVEALTADGQHPEVITVPRRGHVATIVDHILSKA